MRVEPLARGLAWIAMALGLAHAGFSAYWALGGRWLLPTVGEWAVTMADTDPQRAGTIRVDGGYDRTAMIGHVALWDPLFALWGLALLGSLWLSWRRL
jgi:hypothetical protein